MITNNKLLMGKKTYDVCKSASTLVLATVAWGALSQESVSNESNKLQGVGSSLLEEVVVTARRREESSQDVPVALSAFSSEMLEKNGISDLGDLATQVPSLAVAPFPDASSTLVAFIRGVGTLDAAQVTRDHGVGIYLDDVYLGRAQGLTSDMVDLARIEVLRGPQGTLYGRNTIGGAIKFVTAEPKGEFAFKQTVNVGNRDYFRTLTTVDLPETLGVSAKLTYLESSKGGLVSNPGAGPDFMEEDKQGYRIAMQWQPVDDWLLRYAYDYSSQDGTSFYLQLNGEPAFNLGVAVPSFTERRGNSYRPVDLPLKDFSEQQGHALTVQWDASENITIKSISSYRELESERLHDYVEAFGFPIVNFGSTDQQQFSQEFVFNGIAFDSQLDYVFGSYYFKEEADQSIGALANELALIDDPSDPINGYRAPQLSDLTTNPRLHSVENTSSALYAHVSYRPVAFEQRLDFSVGGRYSRDDRQFERKNSPVTLFIAYQAGEAAVDYSSFDPSATVDYRWTENLHSYLRWSKAYRSGGFNLRSAEVSDGFDKEELESYELGLKSLFWDNRFKVNMAVYRSSYEDIQLDFLNPADFSTNTFNGNGATVKGAELEISVVPVTGLSLMLDYAYMDASQEGDVINPFSQLAIDGTNLPYTPRHKYNIRAEYNFNYVSFGELTANLDYSWDDEQTLTGGASSNTQFRDSFGLLNARLSLSEISIGGDSTFSLSVWVKNLENKSYVLYRVSDTVSYGELRSYGLDFSVQF
jgi:iron complex outermembrane recepter protein